MTRIVTYVHRPKRPPRKKAQAAAITGPVIVTATSTRDRERHRETVDDGQEASPEIKAFFAPHDAAARHLMPARSIPRRHWRSYGDHPLPTGAEALDEPLRAFPSWFLRIVCERCGKERMVNEAHMAQGEMLIRDILDRCGTTAAAAARGGWSC